MKAKQRIGRRIVGTALMIVAVLQLPSQTHAQDDPVEFEDGDNLEADTGKGRAAIPVRILDGNLTMDLDFDGDVDSDDDALENNRSAIVIANIDGVYEGKEDFDGDGKPDDEPARRRLAHIQTTAETMELRRSSPDVRLFKEEKGGEDLFGKDGTVIKKLAPGKYWVEGGVAPSRKPGDQFLYAAFNGDKPHTDRVDLTVLWVDLEQNRGGPDDRILKPPLYAHYGNIISQQGHDKLRLHRSRQTKDGKAADKDGRNLTGDTAASARGMVEFRGLVRPSLARRDAFGPSITTSLRDGGKLRPTTADFGFIFRRWVNGTWADNNLPEAPSGTRGPDDSSESLQDVDPDPDPEQYLIVDNDGPGFVDAYREVKRRDCADHVRADFYHIRDNFRSFVVFQGQRGKPAERVSRKLTWAFTADIGFNDEDEATFLFERQNNDRDRNEIVFGNPVDLPVNLPPAEISAARLESVNDVRLDGKGEMPSGGWVLPYAGKVAIIAEGKNLARSFTMVEQGPGTPRELQVPMLIRVEEDLKGSEFSAAGKVKIILCMGLDRDSLPPSNYGYRLKIRGAPFQTFPDVVFVTPRTSPRSLQIAELLPASSRGNMQNVVAIKNLTSDAVDLKGWSIQTYMKIAAPFDRHKLLFGDNLNPAPLIGPGKVEDVTVAGARDLMPPFFLPGYRDDSDMKSDWFHVYLVRPDGSVEDSVSYEIAKVRQDVRIATPLPK